MGTNSKKYMRDYYHKKRHEVIELLGGKCAKCGNDNYKDLEINHKNRYNGNVSTNGTRGGMRNLWDAIKLIKEDRIDELDVLCVACNHNGEYPWIR